MAILDLYLARFKPDLPYMTEAETKLFAKLRANNTITFFRVDKCEACSKEVYRGKRFCSKKCWESKV